MITSTMLIEFKISVFMSREKCSADIAINKVLPTDQICILYLIKVLIKYIIDSLEMFIC